MDRNDKFKKSKTEKQKVALRKESVDRNYLDLVSGELRIVALRKESVDRNHTTSEAVPNAKAVALRKESVDRNVIGQVKA